MADGIAKELLSKLESVGINEPRKLADKLKDEANQHLKEREYDLAIELYTKAIELDPSVAAYYSNRSKVHLTKELYGLALEDADNAIKADPSFIKGYYRRASANMAMGKMKLALQDFEKVYKICPNDKDVEKNLAECRREAKRQAFAKAIASEQGGVSVAESIKLEEYAVENDYAGPRLDDEITLNFMKSLIATFKEQKKLHIRYAYKILLAVKKIFEQQPSLVNITVPADRKFTICGDVHGQFYDLANIFELNGLPSEENPYLFNGDFVDRGSFGVETIFTLLGFKLLYPGHFFMSRGNHESDVMNHMYGFEGEVRAKYNERMANLFTELFCKLPLCHVINGKIFVCHGGLFKEDGVTLEKIKNTSRFRQPPEDGIMCDLLWSDPMDAKGKAPSKRGIGIQFGADVTQKFLEANGLLYVVRSHEVKPEGHESQHEGKCHTIFSAPDYCGVGNKGAYITITGAELYPPKVTTFEAVPHPPVPSMYYASSLFKFLS